mmetsp:Transcript_13909/g.28060  ORF Transcript_13909/g.28060 Transcript_13909/m.28060 type:complete len:619 (-) Transcript_13909:18-1874(-)
MKDCSLLVTLVVTTLAFSVKAFVALQTHHGIRPISSSPNTVHKRPSLSTRTEATRLAVLKDPKESAQLSPDKSTDKNDKKRGSRTPLPPPQKDDDKEKENLPLGLMWSRTLDTMEDAVIHARRMPYDMGWYTPNPESEQDRETIVVLGSGWAAHSLLKCADNFKLRVIVISPTNHFVFTPMLASASVGTVEYRSMTEAVRAANPMIDDFFEGKAIDIDLQKKSVSVQLESLLNGVKEGNSPIIDVPYDKLVVSVGCKVLDDIVPGAYEHCLRLKTIDDARLLRDSVGESFEYASRPDVSDKPMLTEWEVAERKKERQRRVTFTIVGGGPTGVELAGELGDLIEDITKPRVGSYPRLRDDVRIVLIHGGSDLVPQFEPRLRKHALEALEQRGVEVILGTRVLEVQYGKVRYVNKNGGEEQTLDTGLCVWAAGTGPVPFVSKLLEKLPEEAKGAAGKINVDEWMRCPMPDAESFGSILVMGDAAAFKSRKGGNLPQTAQVAGQQGAFAARLLDRDYDLTQTPPKLKSEATLLKAWLQFRGLDTATGFDFLNLGLLAYVGGGQALTEIQLGDVPIAAYAGSISFILWRSVYLVKQVATRNRVLVTFDWMKSKVFGRDITRL